MVLKEFIFQLPAGTIGDQKPLAILAVYAANAMHQRQSTIVTRIISFEFQHLIWLNTVETFAAKLIGKEYKHWLKIEFHSSTDSWNQEKDSIVFTVDHGWNFEQYRGNNVLLDFGDNASMNRFTSLFLCGYKPSSLCFGSLYLPIERNKIQWSNRNAKKELMAFRNKHVDQSLLVIAGSLHLPFDLKHILNWIETDTKKEWVILLIGYNELISFLKLTTRLTRNRNQIHAMKNHVAYEDVAAVAEFFVSNCGAGSVIAPLAAGCAQTCRFKGLVGSDKSFNRRVMEELKLGPYDPEEELTFAIFMLMLEQHFVEYQSNAKNIHRQKQLFKEQIQMQKNMTKFFTDLSQSKPMQKQLQKTNQIPKKYALKKPLR